jgi:hypothetical protein
MIGTPACAAIERPPFINQQAVSSRFDGENNGLGLAKVQTWQQCFRARPIRDIKDFDEWWQPQLSSMKSARGGWGHCGIKTAPR